MELDQVLLRVEQRLADLGHTANFASKLAGKPDAIRNLRRAVRTGDRRGVSITTIQALAATLQTSPEWLAFGSSDDAENQRATPGQAEKNVGSPAKSAVPALKGAELFMLRGTVQKLHSDSILVKEDDLRSRILGSCDLLGVDERTAMDLARTVIEALAAASNEQFAKALAAEQRNAPALQENKSGNRARK